MATEEATADLADDELRVDDTEDGGESEAEIASPPSIEDFARARGWRPKDEWDDTKGEWRDAATFLERGLDGKKEVSRELKELRETVSGMSRAHERLMHDAMERARQEERQKLDQLHRQAVEDGDFDTAQKVTTRIEQLARPQQQQEDPAVNAWIAENPWFNSDPNARLMAVNVCNMNANLPTSQQLELAKAEVFKRFPEYAPKSEATKEIGVGQPSRTARPPAKTKTFHDLPSQAQEAARFLVQSGKIKSTEDYAKAYFNKEGTVE